MTAAPMRPAARDIARMVSIPQLLRQLGWRMRSRRRADCGLCRGGSKGTVAYRDHLWHCHRCHQGGDIFKLVMAMNHWEFKAALAYVAELAGIRIDGPGNVEVQREIVARQRHRERSGRAAEKLVQVERALRLESRDRILRAERRLVALSGATAWTDQDWLTAAVCAATLRCEFATYTLLSFAAPVDRARYCLHPEVRAEIISGVLCTDGVRDAEGKRIEVLQ
jgi:CHC2 zinc finger